MDVLMDRSRTGSWLSRSFSGLVLATGLGLMSLSGTTQGQSSVELATQSVEDVEAEVFQTMGAFAGAQLYSTYLSLGSIADCYVNKTYTSEKVQGLATSLEKISSTLKTRLEHVEPKLVASDDRKATGAIIEALGLLQLEAQQLAKFAKSNAEEDFRAYEQTRTNVWPKIQAILGLQ